MHELLALLRLIHRKLYVLGPGMLPAILSKYRTGCSVILCGLCACAAVASFAERRLFEAVLWMLSGGLVVAGFLSESMMWSPRTGRGLGIAAIAAAAGATLFALRYELMGALAESRRERMKMRQVPGVRRPAPPR